MKCFAEFRLDKQNHLLWRGDERVSITPKAFDVLTYLVDNEGQVLSLDDVLKACWPDTYVNPEILRKYILEIRKALGDQTNDPKFVQTLPKRGYRFVAKVVDDQAQNLEQLSSHERRAPISSIDSESHVDRPWGLRRQFLGATALLGIVLASSAALRHTLAGRQSHTASFNDDSIVVIPFTEVGSDASQESISRMDLPSS